MIYIVDDDREFAECIAKMVRKFFDGEIKIFSNAIEAISAIDAGLPKLVFLDILLDGPDGFTFLNEMSSYEDTASVPIVIMSSLNFTGKNLRNYGVVKILDKAEMTPEDVRRVIEAYV